VLSANAARLGNRTQALNYLERLKTAKTRRYVCDYELATAYATLGDNDAAIEWLNRGYREHSSCRSDLKADPRLDSIRSDPRFQNLLHMLRLDS